MVWIQRIVLIMGILAILVVTFLLPPKTILGTDGVQVPLIAACGTRPEAPAFAQTAGLSSPDYEDELGRYNRCTEQGSVNTQLLALYVAVIATAAGALAYVTRPKVP